jgi:hypothetical protein
MPGLVTLSSKRCRESTFQETKRRRVVMSCVITRRRFVKGAALAASAASFRIVPRHVLGGAEAASPSRKLNLAAIGTGGQALNDLKNMADENFVALCDVDDRRAAEAFKLFPQAKRYRDYRVMLDELGEKIDAVLVTTPDHTHAVATMRSLPRRRKACHWSSRFQQAPPRAVMSCPLT